MTDVPSSLGMIAGRGAYPLELAESARLQGVTRIEAVAFVGETGKKINELCDKVVWIRVGELTPFLDAFKEFDTTRAVMAGQIRPSNLFLTRIDKAMRELLASLPRKNADTIFSAIGNELEKIGVELIDAGQFMESRMPEAGVLTDRGPGDEEWADIRQGVELAKLTAHFKAGQSVAIKRGTVIAVEGFEGTDRMIKRAGKVGGPECTIVKVAQPEHDMRFDIPVVGLRTMRSMRKAKARCLAIEAGKAVLLEKDAVLAEAKRLGIVIVVLSEEEVIDCLKKGRA